ncbi:MAG: GTPase ObgE [Elusimicrobiota bacterium]
MFVDKAKISIKAGKGGDGCVSFRREKYVPFGGPEGGSGGKGGDVYLVADPHVSTLLDFTYRPHYRAQDGMPGKGKNMEGGGGADLVIKVPCGTVLQSESGGVIVDMNTPYQKLLIAKGGRGGRGNVCFKTQKNKAPKISEKGEPGQKLEATLELKLLADIGLVGCPNAGKSTLLAHITAARPKIADYPFTTLSPQLGVCSHKSVHFVVADVPGLIEGAHAGRGLGDEFLRHVERTRILVHMVDISGFGGNQPAENFKLIQKEISEYAKKINKNILKKPVIVALNKTDLCPDDAVLKQVKLFRKKTKNPVFAVSAATGKGVDKLLDETVRMFSSAVTEDSHEPRAGREAVREYILEPEFVIKRKDNTFVVSGNKIEKFIAMTHFNQEQSVERFQDFLKKNGIERALKKKGIKQGDIVRILDMEFEYTD